jgi:excisionase family DNA binding protein
VVPYVLNGKEHMANESNNNHTNDITRPIGAREFPILATTRGLAVRYQVSARTIQNWVSRKVLPVCKIGRAVRFNVAACDKALARFERKAAG